MLGILLLRMMLLGLAFLPFLPLGLLLGLVQLGNLFLRMLRGLLLELLLGLLLLGLLQGLLQGLLLGLLQALLLLGLLPQGPFRCGRVGRCSGSARRAGPPRSPCHGPLSAPMLPSRATSWPWSMPGPRGPQKRPLPWPQQHTVESRGRARVCRGCARAEEGAPVNSKGTGGRRASPAPSQSYGRAAPSLALTR